MANLEATIANFVAGDHLSIERTVTSVPNTTLISGAWFTIKRKYTDIDSGALVQKYITTSYEDGVGHIDDSGADGTGHLIFLLTPEDTVLLTPLSDYKYDIQIRLSTGMINTPESGIITAFPQVTITPL
jgi:hypothetical protein